MYCPLPAPVEDSKTKGSGRWSARARPITPTSSARAIATAPSSRRAISLRPSAREAPLSAALPIWIGRRASHYLRVMAALELHAPCPPFHLPGTDGRSHTLAELAGKLVVVMVSCNHCPYVIAYEPRVVTLAKDYRGARGGLRGGERERRYALPR